MKRLKRDQKRSRAINKIVLEIGISAWEKLTTSEKNKKIKIKLSKFKKKAKKERGYIKSLNKEYRGYISA